MKIDFPRAREPVINSGVIRTYPEDFIVEEQLGFELDGEGEHLWVWLEKTSNNTDWVARQLARLTGVRAADVGYAGLKDRHAVTRQWFSLPDTHATISLSEGELVEGVQILRLERHTRKLRRGGLKGNRFCIRVRTDDFDTEAVQQRVEDIRQGGVPNYFGEQRFGREGRNVDKARSMFAGQLRPKGRSEKSILLSAARSWFFNQILASRVLDQTWNRPLEGDVFQLEGSHSVFKPDQINDEINGRVKDLDIHPTGCLWGRGELRTTGSVAELECSVAAREPVLMEGLERAGLKQERRALRLSVSDLSCTRSEDGLIFEFSLPAGAYATSVLSELAQYVSASAS